MRFRTIIAIVAAGLTCSAATTQTKKTTPRKTATAPRKQGKTSTARSAHSKRVTHATQKASARPAHPAAAKWRTAQTVPTPDRYREIQAALAKKGYLHGEASGVWNQDSADALRHFQQDQNLQASGKLDSLSIIALGLGPKY
jgi:peptidoglycan hydrolase-like protein with peptidoglycan-binding domain